MPSTKFPVNGPLGSGEEAQNRFPRQWSWWPSWISDLNDFNFFLYIQVTLMLPTKFQGNWPFSSEAKNRFSRWIPIGLLLAILIY